MDYEIQFRTEIQKTIQRHNRLEPAVMRSVLMSLANKVMKYKPAAPPPAPAKATK